MISVDTNYYYLILMALSISFPMIRSFEKRLKFYKNWKHLFIAEVVMMTVFITWDIIFTKKAIWHFNEQYILGYKFLDLPIEEWLFFICVPYSCLFIHEVLNHFFPLKNPYVKIKLLNVLTGLTLLTIGMVNYNKTYTCVCFILTGTFILLIQQKNVKFLSVLYRTFLTSLFPFFIVNGVLTGSLTNEPIVIYDDLMNTGIRIFTIPIEDFVYCLFMLGLTIWVYEERKNIDKSAQVLTE